MTLATIRDVAKKAGVSVATVSRVINDSGYVGQDTRKKVKQAIEELNYSPNEVARSLYQRKSKLIGLLIPDISNPFFPLLARGAEDHMRSRGYQAILGNVQEDPEIFSEYLKTFNKNNVAGVLSAVNTPAISDYAEPLVIVDRVTDKTEYSVFSNDYQGGMLAAKAILQGRPKNILVVAGPQAIKRSQDRIAGIESILSRQPIAYKIIHTNSFQIADAEKMAFKIFEDYPEIDSVIAPNDIHALAILKQGLLLGKKIPQELQVIGYDDIPMTRLSSPTLSTIHQSTYRLGWLGAKLLIDLIEDRNISDKKIMLPVRLVAGDTIRK
ncbi:LacI family DNA-binding transcriptional regulator [Lapidilactobacillus wuchangensis]|uniref:LacI family DNA-binding transcriptional regulator n=1 Tax=Lapidilactobacillus wuchangensis TaxID=2486001 RepID=UPI000F7A4F5F|nr:LacI family DNA-binding transcriptional regulator [Lapidilactobacillus wuchangensis]